ncbi:cyclic GMP-AMP phosphodiesterase SMPDL3A isoform 3-T4 [Spinachia spinachia]
MDRGQPPPRPCRRALHGRGGPADRQYDADHPAALPQADGVSRPGEPRLLAAGPDAQLTQCHLPGGGPAVEAVAAAGRPADALPRRLLLAAGQAGFAGSQPQHHPLLRPRQSHGERDGPGRPVPVAGGDAAGRRSPSGEGKDAERGHALTFDSCWFRTEIRLPAFALQVYVIAHVPVGYLPYARNTPAVRERHNERLVAIFRAHGAVIAGHFYGHTHRDSVMVLLDRRGKPLTSLFVSPAVTPLKHAEEPYSNNPALRAYLYDAGDYAVLDVWQYFLNLTEANEKQRADWRLEYIMTEAFGLRDLRPPRLLRLGLGFLLPPADAFRRYFAHFMVSYDGGGVCEGECKLLQVCAVMHLDRRAYSRCVAGGRSPPHIDTQYV